MTIRPRPLRTRRPAGRRVATAGLVVAAVTTTGVATAYWTAPGSGSGTAATGTTQPVTLGPGTPTASLFPGGRADVALVAANPNPGPVVPQLVLDPLRGTGGFDVDAAHPGCPASSFAFHTPATGTPAVPPGDHVVTLPDAVGMLPDAPDECQGVTVIVYLRAAS